MKKQLIIIMNYLIPITSLIIGILSLNENRSIINYSIVEDRIIIPQDINNNDIKQLFDIHQIPNHSAKISLINSGNMTDDEVKLKIKLANKAISISTNPAPSEKPLFVNIKDISEDSTLINIVLDNFLPNNKFDIIINAITIDRSLISETEITSTNGSVKQIEDMHNVRGISKFDILKIPIVVIIIWLIVNIIICIKKREKQKGSKKQMSIPHTDNGIPSNLKSIKDKPTLQQLKLPLVIEVEKDLIIINRANMRCIEEGDYCFQIDIKFRANEKKIFIDRIILKNNGYFTTDKQGKEIKQIEMLRLIKSENTDYTDQDISYYEEIARIFKTKTIYKTNEIKIEKDEQAEFSMIGILNSIRLMDGYDELPLRGWNLDITYNSNKNIIVPFLFNIRDYKSWYYSDR